MDRTTRAGAELLAARIASYWNAQGWEVTVWVEQLVNQRTMKTVDGYTTTQVWGVRSDMINGHPQRKINLRARQEPTLISA